MKDDAELLRRYHEEGAHDAFAEVVRRHVNLVYSAALRQLHGDAHLAADATQLVFTDLARKAATVAGHRVLAGWLFTSTRFVTAKLIRGERRRRAREEQSQLMPDLTHDDTTPPLNWESVRPVLDDVMGELNDADREAILLRFFEGRDYAGVGAKLNVADNTARMRVERALDKLRALLERQGVTSTSAALAAALAHQAVSAAPLGLAASVTGAALAAGISAAGTAGLAATSTAQAAATFMSITKLQVALTSVLAVSGAAGFLVQAEATTAMRDEAASLRQRDGQIAALEKENSHMTRTAAEVAELRRAGVVLPQLRAEAAALKSRDQELARARASVRSASGPAAAPRPVEGPVFDVSTLDQVPVAKFQARPNYPAELRQAGTSGHVLVDFVVDGKGDVQNAFAARSSQPEFELPAVQAVAQWKFQPGQKTGLPVNTRLQVPIVFTVKPGSSAGELSWPAVKEAGSSSAPWF